MTSPHYDLSDLVIATVRPTVCQGCHHIVDAAILTLEAAFCEEHGDFIGIAVSSHAICCGHHDGANVPAALFAGLLNHIEVCPGHGQH